MGFPILVGWHLYNIESGPWRSTTRRFLCYWQVRVLIVTTLILNSWWWNRNIPGELGQCHGCWCPGSMRHQSTAMVLTMTNGPLSSNCLCTLSLLTNYRKCRYIFVFSMINSAGHMLSCHQGSELFLLVRILPGGHQPVPPQINTGTDFCVGKNMIRLGCLISLKKIWIIHDISYPTSYETIDMMCSHVMWRHNVVIETLHVSNLNWIIPCT